MGTFMIKEFPKIFALGTKQTLNLFNNEVEITEKLDGSQIAFGKVNGELLIRSKNCQIFPETVNKMFKAGVDYIASIKDKIPEGMIVYGEYFKSNKQNVLVYDRIPKNHIAVFGAMTGLEEFTSDYHRLKLIADNLELDIVPLLFKGKLDSTDQLKEIINKESYFGKTKMEGCVIKNYNIVGHIGHDIVFPFLSGKYVSEDFKEVHKKEWKSEYTGKGRWEVYKSQFCNKARWYKAVQHLRDKGELQEDPNDIGKLLKEINMDIEAEEKDSVKEWLWNEFGKQVFKSASAGFPQWYKEYLINNIKEK